MRRTIVAALSILIGAVATSLPLSGPVRAQDPIVATPLPAIDPTAPEEPPVPRPRAPHYPDVWVPMAGATIQALDKVNARSANLTVPNGRSATYQSLTIAVRSCLVRPSDQPVDAAAFVTVTDAQDPARSTGLWLVRSAPAASMLRHPIYDLRVLGCTS